jgi:hypothetical protein
MSFRYQPEVLAEFSRHGIIPNEDTPPELIHEFINDLYLYEIRALRNTMRAGLIPKDEYAGCVAELRRRYPILSLPIRYWTK